MILGVFYKELQFLSALTVICQLFNNATLHNAKYLLAVDLPPTLFYYNRKFFLYFHHAPTYF